MASFLSVIVGSILLLNVVDVEGFSFGICLDTSMIMRPVVLAVKQGMKAVINLNMRRDYVAVPYFQQTLQTFKTDFVRKYYDELDTVIVHRSSGLEYNRLWRAVELSNKNSVILFFSYNMMNLNPRILQYAQNKNVTFHYFLNRCCLDCSQDEKRFIDLLYKKGHGRFCFTSPVDAMKVLAYIARTSTTASMIQQRSTFSNLLRQRSLAFSMEGSLAMKSQWFNIQNGIQGSIRSSPHNVLHFGVMSSKTVYYYGNESEVQLSFSKAKLQLLNITASNTLLDDRINKSIDISFRGSIIYSFSPTIYQVPDSSLFKKAKSRDLVIHFFLTNCGNVSAVKQALASTEHGVYCIKPIHLQKLMDYVKLTISKKPLDLYYGYLRSKYSYMKLFQPETTTTLSTTKVSTKATTALSTVLTSISTLSFVHKSRGTVASVPEKSATFEPERRQVHHHHHDRIVINNIDAPHRDSGPQIGARVACDGHRLISDIVLAMSLFGLIEIVI